jgi:hypothetical protein
MISGEYVTLFNMIHSFPPMNIVHGDVFLKTIDSTFYSLDDFWCKFPNFYERSY